MNLLKGEKYKHDKTGGVYQLITHVSVKNPHTRKWEAGVAYHKPGGKSEVWVRTVFDFEERFSHYVPDKVGDGSQ